MAIMIDKSTRVLVQGLTGRQAQVDSANCLSYGAQIVAGVTPGKGGQEVLGLPIYNSVRGATLRHDIDASVIYVPAAGAASAALEALHAGVRLVLITSEGISRHEMARVVATAASRGASVVGPNTNGIIVPGQTKLGGIGGKDPADIYAAGRIGICSRSGGMSAEIGLSLKSGGYGVSTGIAMGGDRVTGGRMVDYVRLFEEDPQTDAIVIYGEPGSENEMDLARHLHENGVRKPILALIAGLFQENYPTGMSFGHAAAMISSAEDSASAKRRLLAQAGAIIVDSISDLPHLLQQAGISPTQNVEELT
ncbi:succinate--CoA ligase subunit alpha [Roseinatronobacter bogoriensis]|uniref:Succinate--CoA ligase subunit alpha n=1 Tax=Roseinatronobacter bogoriensis subsp. barguzinensis TaxID=441209 RepID=A0A2K8KDQ2_9RHOB|nr:MULTISPECIES: CoA-binding protein [Rhodobaca]ATX67549.1 succinate--CoA ligase subunit alpha [Rhodobaca barguzinensis]MBB4209703.1 succinyl-CoA synthetase alpha subunit [Rhodobaca bogoriensis DSM 18756]TDW33878.1 succinyl-CoA synthetase alpha subunit [Rhodobaca barguzinensis]TDY66272.1 succinyl-CoA synthetase alpha subunit [Rhodobaca bogoriensis DSM 18756]